MADVDAVLSWGQWGSWLRALSLFLVGLLVARLATRFITYVARKRLGPHHVAILRRFVFYGLFILFFMSALKELGFEIGVLLGAAGVLSVAVGFASQTSASNLISGLFLLGERPFQVGDIIEVAGIRGEILSIDLLSLKLRTVDNLYVRIPNETLIKSNVTNYTRFPLRRIDLVLGIARKENVSKVKELLLNVVAQHPVCLEEPKPFVIMTGFGASSMDLQLSFFVRKDVILVTRSEILEKIKQRLEEENIEIPFPHTSLYTGSATAPFPIRLVTDQPDAGGKPEMNA